MQGYTFVRDLAGGLARLGHQVAFVTCSSVASPHRGSAKTVNFGILYGMGAFSLAKNLGITNDSAKDFIKAYFDRYPGDPSDLDGDSDGRACESNP